MFQRRREAHEKKEMWYSPEVRRPGAPEGRGLIWLLHLQALAEQKWSGLHALGGPTRSRYSRRTSPTRPGTPPRHFEAACRT
ncbi:hypothetical protein TNCV_4133501 [Trichonephila clavipes]|uniref:Uncharacterized protein n=1 Tax=Trichonephila clavipes TaxID=2585209 RepID=A0A8X6SAE0_TRICX|nr:hypothetical protein TNCV_4133501 [Trichonephila clavipes]